MRDKTEKIARGNTKFDPTKNYHVGIRTQGGSKPKYESGDFTKPGSYFIDKGANTPIEYFSKNVDNLPHTRTFTIYEITGDGTEIFINQATPDPTPSSTSTSTLSDGTTKSPPTNSSFEKEPGTSYDSTSFWQTKVADQKGYYENRISEIKESYERQLSLYQSQMEYYRNLNSEIHTKGDSQAQYLKEMLETKDDIIDELNNTVRDLRSQLADKDTKIREAENNCLKKSMEHDSDIKQWKIKEEYDAKIDEMQEESAGLNDKLGTIGQYADIASKFPPVNLWLAKILGVADQQPPPNMPYPPNMQNIPPPQQPPSNYTGQPPE